jgi:hypothetical protein
MHRDRERNGDRRQDSPARATPQLVQRKAPGKRTLTMGLSATSSTSAPARQRKPAARPPSELASPGAEAPVEDWMAVALRPDLHQAPILRKSMSESGYAGDVAPAPASGGGAPMPALVRAKMEDAFGVDFSSVRIHQGPQAQALNALAYTQGTDIHMAPGQYDPHGQQGQELLGHELAHVVQQAQGRVGTATQAKGVAINDDPALEHEADLMGVRAARGERADGAPAGQVREPAHLPAGGAPAAISRKAVVQRLINEEDIPIIEALGNTLTDYRTLESSKVAGTLVYEQGGRSDSYDAGAFDNAYQEANGTYTMFAYGKDPKKAHDAEAKLLDVVAGKLELLLLSGVPITRATLHLRGNRGPCNRCQGVIHKFQQDYSFVEVQSYYQQVGQVEKSNIENDMGKGTYQNGYPSAQTARSQYVGARYEPALENLWYQHLQSQDDHDQGIDPKQELQRRREEARTLEKRAQYLARARKLRDKIFYSQMHGIQVRETHTLEADKARGRKDTLSQYKGKIELPDDGWLAAIHRDLSISWSTQAKQGSAAWSAVITYPSLSLHDKHHATVKASLQANGSQKGFTYKARTRLDPDPAAKRSMFDDAFDAYLDEVEAGKHEQSVRSFEGRLDIQLLPSFVS